MSMAPDYYQNPNAPNQTETDLQAAVQALLNLGWTALQIGGLGDAEILAAAAAGRPPPGSEAQVVGGATGGYYERDPVTGEWQQVIPGTGGGGGGGAGPTARWQINWDTGQIFNDLTGQVQQGFDVSQGPQLIPLSSGERLIMQNPDGTYEDVTPGGGGDWKIVNTNDALYRFNGQTGAVEKLADFPMSEYDRQQLEIQRQQMAIEAAQMGVPNVAFNYGGTQYQQVRPEAQVMAGQQPQVAFQQRPQGAAPGTPFTPATTTPQAGPGAIPEGAVYNRQTGRFDMPAQKSAAEIEAGVQRLSQAGVKPMTPDRAVQIGTAFAGAATGGQPVFSRLGAGLGGLAGMNIMGGSNPGPTPHRGSTRYPAQVRAQKAVAAMAGAPALGVKPVAGPTAPAPPPVAPAGGLEEGLASVYRRRKRIPAVA